MFTQYVIRIKTLVRGFCPEEILSRGDFIRGDYVLDSVKFWFQKIVFMTNTCGKIVKVSNVCSNVCSMRSHVVVVM